MTFKFKSLFMFLILTACIPLAACSGGGSGIASTPTIAPVAKAAQTARVSLSVAIPKRKPTSASMARKPQYISPSTTYANVTINGQLPPVNLPCTATTCSGTISAPLGTDSFTVSLYDGPPGYSGTHLLSIGTSSAIITVAGPNVVNIACDGIVVNGFFQDSAHGYPSFVIGSFILGQASMISIPTLYLQDPDGDLIHGTGNLNGVTLSLPGLPVAVASHFTFSQSNNFTAAQTVLDSTITLAYDGAPVDIGSNSITVALNEGTTQLDSFSVPINPATIAVTVNDATGYPDTGVLYVTQAGASSLVPIVNGVATITPVGSGPIDTYINVLGSYQNCYYGGLFVGEVCNTIYVNYYTVHDSIAFPYPAAVTLTYVP